MLRDNSMSVRRQRRKNDSRRRFWWPEAFQSALSRVDAWKCASSEQMGKKTDETSLGISGVEVN